MRFDRCLPDVARVVYRDRIEPGEDMIAAGRTRADAATVALAALVLAVARAEQPEVPDGDWWTIDRDLAGTRFSPLDEITPDNVTGLVESWRIDLGGASTAVPLAVDGIVYTRPDGSTRPLRQFDLYYPGHPGDPNASPPLPPGGDPTRIDFLNRDLIPQFLADLEQRLRDKEIPLTFAEMLVARAALPWKVPPELEGSIFLPPGVTDVSAVQPVVTVTGAVHPDTLRAIESGLTASCSRARSRQATASLVRPCSSSTSARLCHASAYFGWAATAARYAASASTMRPSELMRLPRL